MVGSYHGQYLRCAPARQWLALDCSPRPVSLSAGIKAYGVLPHPSSTQAPRTVESSQCLIAAGLHRREYRREYRVGKLAPWRHTVHATRDSHSHNCRTKAVIIVQRKGQRRQTAPTRSGQCRWQRSIKRAFFPF